MSECIWGQCGREAKWQLEIRLWGQSTVITDRTQENCLRLLSTVTVCDECRIRVKVADMLPIDTRERIGQALMKMGRDTPDFDTGALHFIEIIDEPMDPEKMIPPGAEVIRG